MESKEKNVLAMVAGIYVHGLAEDEGGGGDANASATTWRTSAPPSSPSADPWQQLEVEKDPLRLGARSA
jgi:hypothetical protein